ncbi:GFA family protein [uncultured Shewanella sp.]|uniref:GFA family protein n=1 Tax=uncultured Shewanella sp. TaxID=173975 RepID=UPI00263485E9|nr:GFA family protein [uncultured Shewanella sp.]
MDYPVTAACQCGQVSYTLNKKPIKVLACHCCECQILSSSPFSITAVVSKEDIHFQGEMKHWSRIADSGNQNHAKFCPSCGTRIYHVNPAQPDLIKLKLKPVGASIDQDFAPIIHVWTSEKPAWYQIPVGIETLEKQ